MSARVLSGAETAVALLRAGNRVRGGFTGWIQGAPTHVLAELQNELLKDGVVLAKTDDDARSRLLD